MIGNVTAFSPPIKATFNNQFGETFTSNFVDIDLTLGANDHPGLVNKELEVYAFICNGISFNDWNDCHLDYLSSTDVEFESSSDSVDITLPGVAMYFLGDNYITCLVYDPATEESGLCGDTGSGYFDYKNVNYTGGYLPIHRFWSSLKGSHFFTISQTEKEDIEWTYSRPDWGYEGVAFFASRPQVCDGERVYRFWSTTKQSHFYTMSQSERDHVIANYPENVWRYEGVAYCAEPSSSSDGLPVHRFWSTTKQSHFYTISESEKDQIIDTYDERVWRYEGVAFRAFQ